MIPLHHDPHFTFRFAEDRIIPRFHLEGIEAGRRILVFKIDPRTGERLELLATATVGDGGWADLAEPIIVRTGDAFVAVPTRLSVPKPSSTSKRFVKSTAWHLVRTPRLGSLTCCETAASSDCH